MKKEELGEKLTDAEYISVGSEPTDSKATLCIYADDIDLALLTKRLDCQPTSARHKGEKDIARPRTQAARTGQWFLSAPDGVPFTEQVKFLVESTESNSEVWREICQSHNVQLRCAIFLQSWTEGFSFSPELVSEIANRYWEFSLSMYSAEGDEIVDAFLKDEMNRGK